VQALRDAVVSAEIVVYNREFKARPDAERITAQLSSLAKATMSNLQDLQDILILYRQADNFSGRGASSEPPVEASQAQDVRYTLLKHTSAFQRVAELVQGREDWTKLSPRVPSPPSRSPDSLESSNRLHPGDPSSSKITISAPPSPYQPTVEDFEGSSDEEVVSHVQEYHYVPPEESKTQVLDQEPISRVETRTPPQVIVRTATDSSLVDSPRKRPESQSSPLSYSSSAYDQSTETNQANNESSRKSSAQHRPSELPRLLTKVAKPKQQTSEEVQAEIQRLQDELEFMRVSRSATQEGEVKRRKSRRRHHHSVDLRKDDDYPHEDLPPRRPRASTSTLERPRSYIDESSSESRRESFRRSPRDQPLDQPLKRTLSGRTRLSPGHSPRHPRSPRNPYSTTEPLLDKYGRTDPLDHNGGLGYTDETYGTDPRMSLPTVVETSKVRSRRNTNSTRANRTSQNFDGSNDFRDYFRQGAGGTQDFELFGPPSAGARSKGDSRNHSTSPAAPLPPSPRPQNVDKTEDDGPTVRKLPVTLEDLFYGTTKRVKVKRHRYHTQTGRLSEEEKILDVPIYKGLKPGSKVKFQSEGDETLLGSMKELHFVLMEVHCSLCLINNFTI
jgi:hypothetical protein